MKTTLLYFTIALFLFTTKGFGQSKPAPEDRICGLYWSPKKDAKIEIYRRGGLYFGKSTWVANPGKDGKNPNEAFRNRELLGIELLTRFSYTDNIYTGGEVYDPKNGKTYSCKLNLDGDRLFLRGYIGISLFGRTENFRTY